MQFKRYICEEKNIFGFDFEKPNISKPNSELPVDPIDSEIILDELARLPVGNKKPIHDWHDIVEWGKGQLGAIRAEVSPLGSYKMIIRRMIKNLLGEDVWICKQVFPFRENLHNKNELSLAHKLYESLQKIDETMIESPSHACDNFEKVVRSLMARVRNEAPDIFIYEDTKKLDHNNYLIYMSYRGQGVEAPGHMRAEQFDIHVQFDPHQGLLRSWGCEVLSPMRVHRWIEQPAEWDEKFSPIQPVNEIVGAIMAALSTY